jgi:hypothetical protein
MSKKIFDVIYITTSVLILLGILFAIISKKIKKDKIIIIISPIGVMMFVILGWNLGIIFLFLNCAGFFMYKKYRHLILSIFSLIWVGLTLFFYFDSPYSPLRQK